MKLLSYEKTKISNFDETKIVYKTSWWQKTTVDFLTCNKNWKKRHHKQTQVMGKSFGSRMTGYRNAFEHPPYVELSTQPITRIEFASRISYDEFRQLMEKNGWETLDRG